MPRAARRGVCSATWPARICIDATSIVVGSPRGCGRRTGKRRNVFREGSARTRRFREGSARTELKCDACQRVRGAGQPQQVAREGSILAGAHGKRRRYYSCCPRGSSALGRTAQSTLSTLAPGCRRNSRLRTAAVSTNPPHTRTRSGRPGNPRGCSDSSRLRRCRRGMGRQSAFRAGTAAQARAA